MFDGRTRRQIKAKWVREERTDPTRITAALSKEAKKEIDIDYYERMTRLDLTNGIVPADPMNRFYEDLPKSETVIKLESNRPQSEEPAQERINEGEGQENEHAQIDDDEGGEIEDPDRQQERNGHRVQPLFAEMSDDDEPS